MLAVFPFQTLEGINVCSKYLCEENMTKLHFKWAQSGQDMFLMVNPSQARFTLPLALGSDIDEVDLEGRICKKLNMGDKAFGLNVQPLGVMERE